MKERLFGLTSHALRILAYKWQEQLGKEHSSSNFKQMAAKIGYMS